MHFPRRDEYGQATLPVNSINPVVALGLAELPNARSPRPERRMEGVLEVVGFGGEWFDAHDIEEYLGSRGIYLDARSPFATINHDAFFQRQKHGYSNRL